MMEEKSQQQNEQEKQQQHNKLKNDYANIFRICFDLEEEKKEHNLVIDVIQDLIPERKCWRLIGGTLIEKTVQEVVPALQNNIQLLDNAIVNYQTNMHNKEKEILEFEQKNGLKNERKNIEAQNDEKKAGLLA